LRPRTVSSPPSGLDKGEAVEEWLDRHFFRPLGLRIVRAAAPTALTPDQLTLASLLVGLAAGHLFFYADVRLNLAGFVLFLVSDIFDSADGQLARLRGSSTPFGRMLDGVSDYLRFTGLYLHLAARLFLAGGGWGVLVLAGAAAFSHSLQSAANDFVRNLFLAARGGGELDLPEDAARYLPRGRLQRFAAANYCGYVARQARLFPHTVALLRGVRQGRLPRHTLAAYAKRQRPLLLACAWMGQNIRFLLVGAAGVLGMPAAFFWTTLTALNLVLVVIVIGHERLAAALATALATARAAEAETAAATTATTATTATAAESAPTERAP
jgi:phosphatidylglycerophosphate synthase